MSLQLIKDKPAVEDTSVVSLLVTELTVIPKQTNLKKELTVIPKQTNFNKELTVITKQTNLN